MSDLSQLATSALWHIGLAALLAPFAISAAVKLTDWAGAQAEVATLTGVAAAAPRQAMTAGVILLQLGASAWLLFGGRGGWLAALALAGFTLMATFLAHAWWRLPPGVGRSQAFNGFWEHLALVGALLLVAGVDLGRSA